MECGMQPVNSYTPGGLSWNGAFVPNTLYETQNWEFWTMSLASLRDQRVYLEELLCKTSITLNALRNKQTKNACSLSATTGPKSKRKKIEQNMRRTDQAIKTSENEEKVVVNCLRVCHTNISTLEAILFPAQICPAAAGSSWSASHSRVDLDAESTATEFDWNGWAGNDGNVSPFQRPAHRPGVVDEVPPEARLDHVATKDKKDSPLAPSPLSPVAPCFEPGATQDGAPRGESLRGELDKLDKLSIGGLLASKRVRQLRAQQQRRRLSDTAVVDLFRSLCWRKYAGRNASVGPETRPRKGDGGAGGVPLRRVLSNAV